MVGKRTDRGRKTCSIFCSDCPRGVAPRRAPRRLHPGTKIFRLKLVGALFFLGLFLFSRSERGTPPETWIWDRNRSEGNDTVLKKKSLLILQEASPGPIADILEVTSKVNRAYAKAWRYDYAKYTGIMKGDEALHATFNKAYLLETLLKTKGNFPNKRKNPRVPAFPLFDAVLMLGADAVIVDFHYDVLNVVPGNEMIGVNADTEKLNEEVIFLNLKHPHVLELSEKWVELSQEGMKHIGADGDIIFTKLLRAADESVVYRIKSQLVDSFSGEVIKYFRAPKRGMIKRDWLGKHSGLVTNALEQTVNAICYQFFPKCEVL